MYSPWKHHPNSQTYLSTSVLRSPGKIELEPFQRHLPDPSVAPLSTISDSGSGFLWQCARSNLALELSMLLFCPDGHLGMQPQLSSPFGCLSLGISLESPSLPGLHCPPGLCPPNNSRRFSPGQPTQQCVLLGALLWAPHSSNPLWKLTHLLHCKIFCFSFNFHPLALLGCLWGKLGSCICL